MKRNTSGRLGMTLTEIMIVMAIIAMLAAIAIPSFMKARNTVYDTEFAAELRVLASGFEMYCLGQPSAPASAAPGVLPDGVDGYLRKDDWTDGTPLGGQWQWTDDIPGIGQGILALGVTASVERMQGIDRRMDDGNLNTGNLRTYSGGYLYIVVKSL